MDTIFISYRREESAGHAGRIFDRLQEKFGKDRVFMDVSAIEPGVDFVEAIDRAVGSCAALLVVIGRDWLACADAAGRRRLDDPKDFIRLEVGTALRRNIRVVPVLVQGAAMPGEEALPAELKLLARRNAIEINDTHWDSDLAQLVQTLERVLGDRPARVAASAEQDQDWLRQRKRSRLVWLTGSIVAAVLALTGLLAGVDSFREAFVRLFGERAGETATTAVPSPPGIAPSPAPQPPAPAPLSVPKVVGLPEQEAVDTLRGAGFTPTVEQRVSAEDRPGTVVHQEPSGGAALPAGAGVVLHVAKAPAEPPAKPPPAAAAKVAVPDVVGQTLDMARGTLTKQGFSVEVAGEDERSDVPPGTVLRHFPKAGDKLDHGGKVGLVIAIMSAEPEWVTVPNVVKQPLGRAVQMLVAAGLQPGAETPRASKTVRPGTVLDQKVKSDTKVKRGTKVDLLVAVQPPSEGTDGGARSPRILAKGGLEVRQTYLFDLDTGKVVRNEDADFWFEAVTETERYLVPRNGATIGFTREKGDYDSCSRVKMTQQRIPVAKLPTDAYACVRTSRGNLAAFRVREPVGPSPGVLRISYIVWGE